MSERELVVLRARAAQGDQDAVGQLVELAGERGDLAELRHLADGGSSDAADVLTESTRTTRARETLGDGGSDRFYAGDRATARARPVG